MKLQSFYRFVKLKKPQNVAYITYSLLKPCIITVM